MRTQRIRQRANWPVDEFPCDGVEPSVAFGHILFLVMFQRKALWVVARCAHHVCWSSPWILSLLCVIIVFWYDLIHPPTQTTHHPVPTRARATHVSCTSSSYRPTPAFLHACFFSESSSFSTPPTQTKRHSRTNPNQTPFHTPTQTRPDPSWSWNMRLYICFVYFIITWLAQLIYNLSVHWILTHDGYDTMMLVVHTCLINILALFVFNYSSKIF